MLKQRLDMRVLRVTMIRSEPEQRISVDTGQEMIFEECWAGGGGGAVGVTTSIQIMISEPCLTVQNTALIINTLLQIIIIIVIEILVKV